MAAVTATFSNRVTELLGVDIPIVQAPMGWIARSQLASAVSNAGAMGIIETSSGELDIIRDEIRKMRDLTDKPFGVNIAQAFVRDPVDRGVRGRAGREVRDDVGREPHEVHRPPEGGRAHGLPRGAEPRRRAEGRRRGRRRAHRRGWRGRRLQEPAPGVDDGAAPARRLEGRRAGDRRRWVRRRPDHGRRPRARRGGCAARHPHGLLGRVAHPRQLEAGGARRAGDRHRLPQPAHQPRPARPADRAHQCPRVRHGDQRHGPLRQRHGPLLRGRHGGRRRVVRPGGRAHRRDQAGRPDHRRVRHRLPPGAGRPRGALPGSAQLTSSWALPW